MADAHEVADRRRLTPADPTEDDMVDAFTSWLLKWQHWILPCLALAFVASFLK